MVKYTQDHCFYKLKTKSTCREKLFNFATNSIDWTSSTRNDKYSFLQITVPNELICDDPVFQALENFNQKKVHPRIFKMPEKIYYALHIDSWRGAALNLLLNPSSKSVAFYNCGHFRTSQVHIEPVDYQMDTYYLLNTQIKHAVINLESDRYMLSLGLGLGSLNNENDQTDFFEFYKNKFIELGI